MPQKSAHEVASATSVDGASLTASTAVQAAAAALAAARRVVIFSGAGMSAESGINTFRDPEVGVWRNKIALALFAIPFGWNWMPSIAWWGYKKFHRPIAAARPNAGHIAVAHLRDDLQLATDDEDKVVQVITQNVDALHQRAGTPASLVYELHGSVWRHRCIQHGHPMDVFAEAEGGEACEQQLPATQPRCGICGSPARPDAVLFTEALPEAAWSSAEAAVRSLRAGDVLLVVGTSGVVQPAASLPGLCRRGVMKVEINTETTGHSSSMDIVVPFPSAEAIPFIVERAKELKAHGSCHER